MKTAIRDKRGGRHLISTLQLSDQLVVTIHSYLPADWSTEKSKAVVKYENSVEVEFHNKLRATVALRGDKLVGNKCEPKVK